jgi:disulfide bond formation protein DsbB
VSHRAVGLYTALFAALALGTAYGAQYFGGLVPCPLCLLERWPYRVIIALGLLAAMVRPASGRVILGLAVGVLLAAAGLAFLHVGVEFHWWKSPLPECNGILNFNEPLPATPAKPCDEPTYLIAFLPVSMAMMNLIFALAFALALTTHVARKPRRFR